MLEIEQQEIAAEICIVEQVRTSCIFVRGCVCLWLLLVLLLKTQLFTYRLFVTTLILEFLCAMHTIRSRTKLRELRLKYCVVRKNVVSGGYERQLRLDLLLDLSQYKPKKRERWRQQKQ